MSLKVLSIFLLGSLISVGAQDFYCPGQRVEFTCSDALLVKWQGSAFTGQCPGVGDTISIIGSQVSASDVGNVTTCGVFNANITSYTESQNLPGTFVVGVTLSFTAELSLNGLTVQCEDEDGANPLEVDVMLTVPETPTPTISVDQVSQDSVSVSFTVDDNRCVSNYNVNATETVDNGTTIRHSDTMSPVTVTGLDICQNNYSFVGYVTAQNGEQSSLSMSVDFTIDFTVINPVGVLVRLPPTEPILSWTHDVTPMFPTCVTGFLVTDDLDTNNTLTVGPNIRELTTEQLINASFEYCVTIRPVVTPITGMGPLTLRSDVGGGLRDTYLRDPDFPTPMLSYRFMTTNESSNVTLRIMIQNVSDTDVPMRTFRYQLNDPPLIIFPPTAPFTGDYFEIDLGDRDGGETVEVTVNFQDRQCTSRAEATYTVPANETTTPALTDSMVDSLTVTVTLPLTEFQPEELQIISTIDAPGVDPKVSNFTRPGDQFTVMFSGLEADTSYMVTIRIVQRADNTVDVVPAVTETFMTQMMPTTPTTTEVTTTPTDPSTTPVPPACGTGCIVGIIIAVVAFVIVIIVIIVVIVVVRNKKRSGSMKVTSEHEMEGQPKPIDSKPPSSPIENEPEVTGVTFQNEGGKASPSGEQADGGDGANPSLIYADLDLAKKSKPKAQDTPGAAATKEEEPVQYASIEYFKKDEGTDVDPPKKDEEPEDGSG